jgi:hypothetical protein
VDLYVQAPICLNIAVLTRSTLALQSSQTTQTNVRTEVLDLTNFINVEMTVKSVIELGRTYIYSQKTYNKQRYLRHKVCSVPMFPVTTQVFQNGLRILHCCSKRNVSAINLLFSEAPQYTSKIRVSKVLSPDFPD